MGESVNTKHIHLVLRKSVTTNYAAMLVLISIICNRHLWKIVYLPQHKIHPQKTCVCSKCLRVTCPRNMGTVKGLSFHSIKTYLSPWRKSHGCKFKLPLGESLVYEHHAEVVCKVLSQKMPFETSVEKPDLGILSLQVGFTLAFTQIYKTHLKTNLYRNMHTL